MEYQANPAPVVRHAVDFFDLPDIAAPPVDDVVFETRGGVGSVFPVASEERRQLHEQQRRDIEKAWGVWIWLVADLVPDGTSLPTNRWPAPACRSHLSTSLFFAPTSETYLGRLVLNLGCKPQLVWEKKF